MPELAVGETENPHSQPSIRFMLNKPEMRRKQREKSLKQDTSYFHGSCFVCGGETFCTLVINMTQQSGIMGHIV